MGAAEESEQKDVQNEKLETVGTRHVLAFMAFLAIVNVYAMRTNLSVAIVAMVNSTSSTNDSDSESCPFPDDYDPNDSDAETGDFDWDESTQGIVLGSFFYGYALTNIIGGRAAEYFGGKRVVGAGIVITAILTIFSPLAANVSSGFFIAVRILEGCSEGVVYPGVNTLIANWYPRSERSKFTSFIFAGMQFGTVIAMTCSGWLSASDFMGGWPSAFYVFGILSLVWAAFWFWLISDSPSEHPRISQREKEFILRGCPKKAETLAVPWKTIATSVHFWAIAVMHFGYNWGFYTLLTEIPTYLDQILHIDMKNNGLYSALPYCGGWVFSISFGFAVDYFNSKNMISLLTVRRLSMVVSGYGPMLCLIGMCFVDCNSTLALTVLFVSGTVSGGSYCGYMSSHADIAPRFAGTLMGLTNTLATIPGFVSPSITGAITHDNQTLSAWRTVFLISVGVYIVTTTFYVIFVTTDKQAWNDPSPDLQLKQSSAPHHENVEIWTIPTESSTNKTNEKEAPNTDEGNINKAYIAPVALNGNDGNDAKSESPSRSS